MPNCAIAAYGRTWVADISGDRQTVYFSDLLDATNYTTGTSGRLDISEVVGDGDPIVALASHNGFFVIFCTRHIVVYSNAQDPSIMLLSDVITGIGCVARDSVQTTGSDVIFLSDTGVRSLTRTIQEKSAPFRDLSKNVRDDLISYVNGTVAKTIKSVYSPTDAFYLLSFPSQSIVYCFDTRVMMQDGAARTTTWTSLVPYSFTLTKDKEVYLGVAGYVGQYTGYQDDGVEYSMSYFTNYFDYQTPTTLKIFKKADFYIIGGASQTVAIKWDFDYEGSYESQVRTLDALTIAEFGIAEYNIGKYAGGVVITKLDIPTSGTGRVLQIGLECNINGNSVSIQKLDTYIKLGRTA